MAHASTTARQRPNYLRVFVFLAVLTAIEVGVALLPVPKSIQVLLLIALALGKASLVAMYYMHLRYEGQVLRIVAIGPLLFAIILTILPLFDLALR